MSLRLHRSVALAVVAAGLLAGCGSGSASTTAGATAGGSTAASANASAPSSAPSASTAASSAAATQDAGSGGGGDFCTVIKNNLKGVSGQDMSSLLAKGTPEAWKAYLAATEKANQALVDAAPAEIRPAVETLKKSADDLQTALAAANYDQAKMDMTKLLKSLSSPDRKAASDTFNSYVLTNCGVDLSKPPA